jgi:putative peptidoglycan lipid II flippase
MRQRSDGFIIGTFLIGALTLLSRILGLARDMLCAAVFGIGPAWDAFLLAFRVPNLFRRLFGEGALSAAFIPAFTACLETKSREEAYRLAGRVATSLGLVLLGLLIAGELAVLSLRRLTVPGERWHLVLTFTAILLPYMVFICLTAFAGAMLNSLGHFVAPALAPSVLNVCWIGAVALGSGLFSHDIVTRICVVAGAILAAGVLQLALQIRVLARKGFRWRLSLELLHPDVRRVAASMLPVVLGLAALQINVLVDGLIAVGLAAPAGGGTFELMGVSVPYPMQEGANSVLFYGNRLMQFPLGVFGIALATAVFPRLSSHAALEDWQGFSQSVIGGLRLALFVSLPACAGLILLRAPAIELFFNRGQFHSQIEAAPRTAAVLTAYSTAIWAYCALHVLSRAFYSINRHATPAKAAGWMVLLNLALNLTLVWPLREAGLAAATAICAVLQVLILWHMLNRHVRLEGSDALRTAGGKSLLATAIMSGACWLTLRSLPNAHAAACTPWKLARLLAPMLVGIIVYVGASAALRADELRMLCAAFRRNSNVNGA